MRSRLRAAFAGVWLCAASPGLAQDAERADKLYREGLELMNQYRFTEACPLLEQSERADPGSGTLLALAYCQERCDRLASAWLTYLATIDLSHRKNRPERASVAEERAKALGPRLSTLVVAVPESTASLPGFRISLDGLELERALWGKPVQHNGGPHTVTASAPGHQTFSQTIHLGIERDHLVMTIPVLVPVGSARPWRTATWGFALASTASLAAGITFGFIATAKNNASHEDGHCDAGGCDARGSELRRQAISAANDATVACVLGAVLAAGGLTSYWLDQSSTQGAEARLGAELAPGRVQLRVQGRF